MDEQEISPFAIASLSLSFAGVFTGGIFAVFGIVFGYIAIGQINRGDYRGRSLASSGLIVGFTAIALWLLFWIFFFGGFSLGLFGRFFGLLYHHPWIPAWAIVIVLGLALLGRILNILARNRDERLTRQLLRQNRRR